MKVPLREIPCHRTIELSPQFVEQAVSGLPMRQALERPAGDPNAGRATVEVDLYLEDDNVFLRGTIDGFVEVACGRCIGTAHLELHDTLNVTFLPAARMPSDDEVEVEAGEAAAADEEDLDLYPYEGEEVDLEPLLREQVILAVPFAPLCREDCKGLCPNCGTDLNTGTCNCDRTPIDPRWAALKSLKT